jgi:hypothetical protein
VELSAAARPAAGNPGAVAFLDQLARCLVPACDPAVVAAVLARASAGYTTARGRDGRRASAIKPSGVPFEASVTGGDGRLDPALRYTTEAGTGLPFFGPRLAAQRAALNDLVAFLPEPALAAAGELAAFAAVLFPDPGAVPARTRFATTVGVVHTAAAPAGVAALKLYGNLTAEPDALGRLAAADVRIAALAGAKLMRSCSPRASDQRVANDPASAARPSATVAASEPSVVIRVSKASRWPPSHPSTARPASVARASCFALTMPASDMRSRAACRASS